MIFNIYGDVCLYREDDGWSFPQQHRTFQAIAKGFDSPETLSAVASWQSCRESCQREVQEIIDRCKSEGTEYTDESFNPLENEAGPN